MRSVLLSGTGVLMVALAGCATSNVAYERIGYGPELEYAKAKCEIVSMGTERGFTAVGTTAEVAGAAIGNAIGNHVRKTGFVKNCMTLHGWRQVPAGQTPRQQQTAYIAPSENDLMPTLRHAENSPYNPHRCDAVCVRDFNDRY